MKKTIAAVAMALFSLTAMAQSKPWKAVVLTATMSGWLETRGTAISKDGLLEIIVKDDTGQVAEIYKGRLKGSQWTGARTVMGTDNIDEPLIGRFSRRKIENNEIQTLILTNQWVSASFTRTIDLRK
jgi:hypothetical protein